MSITHVDTSLTDTHHTSTHPVHSPHSQHNCSHPLHTLRNNQGPGPWLLALAQLRSGRSARERGISSLFGPDIDILEEKMTVTDHG